MNLLAAIALSVRRYWRAPGPAVALLLSVSAGVGSYTVLQGFIHGLLNPGRLRFPASAGDLHSVFPRHGQSTRLDGFLTLAELRAALDATHDWEWTGVARISRGAITKEARGGEGGASQASRASISVVVAEVTPSLAALLQLPLGHTAIPSHRVFHQELAGAPGPGFRISWNNGRRAPLPISSETADPETLEGLYSGFPIDIWAPLDPSELAANRPAPRSGTAQYWLVVRGPRSPLWPAELHSVPFTGVLPGAAASLRRIASVLNSTCAGVLLIAFANVVLFLLSIAITRSREASLCIALGAGHWPLARGVLIDSAVLAIPGGLLGALLAMWIRMILPAFLYEQDAAQLAYSLDLGSIARVATGGAILTVICGLAPLLAISHHRPATVLRREAAGPSSTIQRLQSALLIVQMASCFLLAVSTGFLWNTLAIALRTTVGHRLGGEPVFATIQTGSSTGSEFFQAAERQAYSMPGPLGGPPTRLAWTNYLPGSRAEWEPLRVEPRVLPQRELSLNVVTFTADLFHQIELPPTAGRLFTLADQGCPAAVVNEEAAERLFGGDTAGRVVESVSSGILHPIIGVIRNRGPVRSPATVYWNGTGAGAGSVANPPTRSTFRAATSESIAQPPGAGQADSEFEKYVVSDGYFDAMGFTLVAGRWFTATESSLFAPGCRVAVVNQQAATLYFPGGTAVGASIIDSARRRSTVVGVVAAPPAGAFQRTVEPAVYYPLTQDYTPRMTLHLMAGLPPGKAQDNPAKLWMNELSNRIESLPGAGSVSMKSLDTHLRQTALAPLRIALLLVGSSGAIASFLSIIGLYGALKDTVRRRRRELAIRIALGAGRWRVTQIILSAGAHLAVVGTLAGFAATAVVWHPVLQPGGPTWPSLWFLLAGPAVLAIAVLLSALLPARHAALANPLHLLREEESGNQ